MLRAVFASCLLLLIASPADAAEVSSRGGCIRGAAAFYYRATDKVPLPALVDLAQAVMAQEAGCGKVVRNNDGSVDIGCMQINSTHLATLGRYGITYDALRLNECQNIWVGVWILHTEIANAPDLWTGVGNYNTGAGKRTAKRIKNNVEYQSLVWKKLQKLWANSLAMQGQ